MSHRPSIDDKTPVELTQSELMVLLKYYRERMRTRAKSNVNVIMVYALRVDCFRQAMGKISLAKEIERQDIEREVSKIPMRGCSR